MIERKQARTLPIEEPKVVVDVQPSSPSKRPSQKAVIKKALSD